VSFSSKARTRNHLFGSRPKTFYSGCEKKKSLWDSGSVHSTAGVNLGCLPNYVLESESIRGFWNVRILRQFINVNRPQNTNERVVTDLMKEHEFKYLNIHTILASLFSCYINNVLLTN